MPRDRLADIYLLHVLDGKPVGEPLVELRALALREAPVGGIEDERVREAPATRSPRPRVARAHSRRATRSTTSISSGVTSGASACSDAMRNRRPSIDARSRTRRVTRSSRSSRAARSACSDGGDVDLDIVGTHPSPVDDETLVREHRRELLDVERVPLPPSRRSARRRSPGVCGPEQDLRDPPGLLGRRAAGGVVVIARGLPAAHVGRCSRSSGRARHRHEHRSVQAIDDRIDQIEHGCLGPVHVFEHDDERTLGGEHLEQSSHRPRGVGAARIAHAEELRQSVADRGAVREPGQARTQCRRDYVGVTRRSPHGLRDQLDERRERDPFSVRRGLPDQDRRSVLLRRRERRREP